MISAYLASDALVVQIGQRLERRRSSDPTRRSEPLTELESESHVVAASAPLELLSAGRRRRGRRRLAFWCRLTRLVSRCAAAANEGRSRRVMRRRRSMCRHRRRVMLLLQRLRDVDGAGEMGGLRRSRAAALGRQTGAARLGDRLRQTGGGQRDDERLLATTCRY